VPATPSMFQCANHFGRGNIASGRRRPVALTGGGTPLPVRDYSREVAAQRKAAGLKAITLGKLRTPISLGCAAGVAAAADGMRWTRQPRELAEHLCVDEPTLQARMRTLDPIRSPTSSTIWRTTNYGYLDRRATRPSSTWRASGGRPPTARNA
jgi:hypothetical protein